MSFGSVGPPLLFAVVATGTPGGAMTLATASGSQFGFRRSLPLMTGIALALASLAAAASLGLANALLAAPSLQLTAKIAGTAYLLWLARNIARSGAPKNAALKAPTSLVGGFVLLWLNPKGWAMTLSAAATFTDSAGRTAAPGCPARRRLRTGRRRCGALQGCCSPGRCAPKRSGGS